MTDTIRCTYIQVRCLTFSLCILNGTAALLSTGDYFTEIFASFGISDAWQIFLLAAIACTATTGIFILIARAWSFNISLLLSRSLVVMICALGGVLFTASLATAAIVPRTVTNIFTAASGIALTVGYITQLVLWSHVFSAMSFREIVAHIGFSSAIAALTALVITSLSSSLLVLIVIAASPAVAGLLIPPKPQKLDTANQATNASAVSKNPTIAFNNDNTSDSPYSLWPVFIGVALCMSVLISMWHNAVETDKFPLASIIAQGTFIGFILCALVIGTLAMMSPDNRQLRKVSIWLCPVFAVLILVPCIFTIEPKGIVGFTLGMCTGIGLAFFMTLPLALFCLECNALTKNGLLVLSLAALSFAGGSFVGIMLSLFADSDQTTIVSTMLFIVYLALIALIPKNYIKTDDDLTSEEAISEDPVEIRCGQITEHYSLTSREAEVLSYLAHGRSATYTAKELYVSVETVKVHIKHIYEKLGVHSRDELLNLVQSK